MPLGRLEEQVLDWKADARMDRTGRLLRNIALTGRTSKNGYRYAESALRGAAALYDHKPVFLDHAERRKDAASRSTRDLVGSIVNARYEDGRVRGDVRVLDTESGRTFLALAEGNPTGVGMSHVVLAQRSTDGTIVERIQDVLSVDVVVQPATTTTFLESDQHVHEPSSDHSAARAVAAPPPEPEPDHRRDSAGELLLRLTALVDRLEQWLAANERNSPTEATDRAGEAGAQDVARESMDAPAIPARSPPTDATPTERVLEELLAEASLPRFAITERFRRELLAANGDGERQALISERRALLSEAGRFRPRSASRGTAEATGGRAAFIAAVRSR